MSRQFTTSFFVRRFHAFDGWIEMGEYETLMDAEMFYAECVLLGRFEPKTLTDIVQRDIAVDDLDYVVETELYRRVI